MRAAGMRSRSGGFSLMELLIAMVLMASVGAVTMYSFSSTTQVTVGGSDYNVAYNFARGVLEQFFERVRQDQWPASGFPLSLATAPPRPAVANKTLNGKTFALGYQVNDDTGTAVDVNGDGQEDFRRVDMTVTWT